MPSSVAWLLFAACLLSLLVLFLVFPLLVVVLLMFSINRHALYHRRRTSGGFVQI